MKAWLMDSYRAGEKVIIWVKTHDNENIRIARSFNSRIFLEHCIEAEKFLNENKIAHQLVSRKTYMGNLKKVYSISAPVKGFEGFVKNIERQTGYKVALYNADITPEQMFLYENDLKPLSIIEIAEEGGIERGRIEGCGMGDGRIIAVKTDDVNCSDFSVPLKSMDIQLETEKDIYLNPSCKVSSMTVNGNQLCGDERNIFSEFKKIFVKEDPDVIIMDRAYAKLPYLIMRMNFHRIICPFHRRDPFALEYKGGRSFYSYGMVTYRDYAIRLNGRFLIDSATQVGGCCSPEAIAELVQLSGSRFQQIAGRSFGAVFQSALVRELVVSDMLVPYKEKPIEKPISMLQLLKADNAGQRLDPKQGFHKDVAEIDFSSMFPWIIYNRNISADTLLCPGKNFETVPNLDINVSLDHKGIAPRAIKPFIDRRMHYKKNPTALNKERAVGLKWVLVTSYGYLRFREFKLGIATAHTAICSYAREILLDAMRLAEEKGFEVVHGIVDSLYIKKKGLREDEVKDFCAELEALTGIPVSLEGIFRWIMFLPSIVDSNRPLPSRYYGVFRNNEIKARGIEIRQRSSPLIVQEFQQSVLSMMKQYDSKKEIIMNKQKYYSLLRHAARNIEAGNAAAHELACSIRLSKLEYKNNIPQKIVLNQLIQNNVRVMPGQMIYYVHSSAGASLPMPGMMIDVEKYRKMLVRALYIVLQPLGISKEEIIRESLDEKQVTILEFMQEQSQVITTTANA